ncbi:uncharacterized protein LOC113272952 [Papaver somniferum]|uniref:uncharacterized protein LOC113272952 n=1 Tax=Papaver somniferum TaxID=3469 RepID=UPI000E70505A|nr:uncharacterized protein LOC113272952 [Papaver somniferum]
MGIGVLAKVGKLRVSTECCMCHGAEETVDHLFMQCPVTQAVMFASPLNFSISFVPENTAAVCAQYWLQKEGHIYNFCLGACMWWDLWKSRNKVVFDKAPINIPSILREGLYWFNSHYNTDVQAGGRSMLSLVPLQHFESPLWYPPPATHIKINVDAALSSDKSFAAVARNYHGGFVGAETIRLNTTFPLVDEAHGFVRAIQLVGRLKVIVEGDCQMVVMILQTKTTSVPWRISRLIDEINNKATALNSVEFQFVPKRVNNVAHDFAKFATRHNVQDWWTSSQPPSGFFLC